MIRTKEQLVTALGNGKRLNGQAGSRPSAPWNYEVDGVTVHGCRQGWFACLHGEALEPLRIPRKAHPKGHGLNQGKT